MMDTENRCRLCLKKLAIPYSLLEENRHIILRSLTSLEVDQNDNLPIEICVKCMLNLNLAYKIQQNFIKSDEKLRKALHECMIKKEYLDITDTTNERIENVNIIKSECDSVTESKPLTIISTETSKTDTRSPCLICGQKFPDIQLMNHVKTHYDTKLQCKCGANLENVLSYKDHINKCKQDQTTYTCEVCKRRFLYKPLFIIHKSTAHPTVKNKTKITISTRIEDMQKVYECPYCKKVFKSQEGLDGHMKLHLKKKCTVCGAKISGYNYSVHFKSHSEQPVICQICGNSYKNMVSLRSHIRYTHSTKVYNCDQCNKAFKKLYALRKHTMKEHTGEKNHVCDVCGKRFFTFYNLNKHKKTTHMKLRPHMCTFCKKMFSSRYALKTHERQHTNVTPYNCDVCGEGFRQNISLRGHKKSKHNIIESETNECNICSKKFVSDWALQIHKLRMH